MEPSDLAFQVFSNNPIVIGLLIYSYLLYSLFTNTGKLKKISDLKDIFKIGIIFLEVLLIAIPLVIIMPYVYSLIFNFSVSQSNLTFQDMLLGTLVFTAFPWLINKYSKKTDNITLNGWFKVIIALNFIFLCAMFILNLFISISEISILMPKLWGAFFVILLMNIMTMVYNGIVIKKIFSSGKKRKFRLMPIAILSLVFVLLFILIGILFLLFSPKIVHNSEHFNYVAGYRENYSSQDLSLYKFYKEDYNISSSGLLNYFIIDATNLNFSGKQNAKKMLSITSKQFSIYPYQSPDLPYIQGMQIIKDYTFLFNSSSVNNMNLLISGLKEYSSNLIKINATEDSHKICASSTCNISFEIENQEYVPVSVHYPVIIVNRIGESNPDSCHISKIFGIEGLHYINQICTGKTCSINYGGAVTSAEIIGGNLDLTFNLEKNSNIKSIITIDC